ncbi:MAG: hypothetical protein LBP83_07960 [Dysgonamonadaceae bacterium]|jgi:hypothetical protein|nr:hypothetical protein [Dysgonamonadaceae bacterium]
MKIKIFVQGTKDGYNVLYPQPTPNEFFQFAGDMRHRNVNNGIFRGKSLYSLAFAKDGGCIFTKYVIVHDVQRYSLGNIGLSFFIPKENKITGADAIALLDELAKTYVNNYCPDYNLGKKQEDWPLLTLKANTYDLRLQSLSPDDVDTMPSGTTDAAFIYYRDNTELQRYFDAPYQDEYMQYRQILFVSADLKNQPENPLNALRHSGTDLTGKIDLENPKYKLRFNEYEKNGLKINVTANGTRKCNNDKVRRKSKLEISYEQEYRKPAYYPGSIANNLQCIDIDEQNKTITIKPVMLEKEKKTVNICATNINGKSLSITQIKCRNSYQQTEKPITGNSITFEGDELGDYWDIEVEVNGYENKKCRYKPTEYPDNNSIPFKLEEQKIIEIQLSDDNDQPIDSRYVMIKVFYHRRDEMPKYCIKNNKNKFVFVGNEIDKKWQVEIESDYYEDKHFTTINPKMMQGHIEKIKLSKKPMPVRDNEIPHNEDIIFYFKEGKHGKWPKKEERNKPKILPYKPNKPNTFNIKENAPKVRPDFFFQLDKWQATKKQGEENRICYTAQYKPNWVSIILSSMVVVAVIIGLVCWGLGVFNGKENKNKISTQSLEIYIADNELRLSVLEDSLQTKFSNPPEVKIEKSFGQSILGIFGIGDKEEKRDSTDYNKWISKKQQLENVIALRKRIDEKKFCDSLVINYVYSDRQKCFKNAIDTVLKANKCEEVAQKFDVDTVSSMSLTQIAEKINSILQPPKEEKTITDDAGKQSNPPTNLQNAPNTTTKSNQDKNSGDARQDIIQYIKGNELKKDVLEKYMRDIGKDDALKGSINLCIKFWTLDGSKNKSYSSFQKEINNDTVLQNSELNNFVDKMCNVEKPKYLPDIRGTKTISTLSQLKNLQ